MEPRYCWLVLASVLALLGGGCQLLRDRDKAPDKSAPPVLPDRQATREAAPPTPTPTPAPEAKPAPADPGATRNYSLLALQLRGSAAKDAVPQVIEALQKDMDPQTRCSAAWALVKADPKTTGSVQALTAALRSDPVLKVRIASAEALAGIGPGAKEAAPALRQALAEKEPPLRVAAALALVRIDRTSADLAPVLIAALRDEEAKVRGSAATALGVLGPKAAQAVPALVATLKDPVAGVRLWSAVALGQIGPAAKEAVPALLDGLHDTEYRVAMAMSCALTEIDPDAPARIAQENGGAEKIEQLARENQALMSEHLAVLKGVKDAASAAAARAKLDSIAAQYDQGEKRMRSMPVFQFAVYHQKYHASLQSMSGELEKETARIKSLPDAYSALKGQVLIDPVGR